MAAEADDQMIHELFELIGEDHVLFSSDFPHGEGRDNAALEILERDGPLRRAKKKPALRQHRAPVRRAVASCCKTFEVFVARGSLRNNCRERSRSMLQSNCQLLTG